MKSWSFLAQPRRPAWRGYLFALMMAVLGVGVRECITPWVGPNSLPFTFLYPGVVAAAWYGGLGPAFFCCVAGALAADWFFFAPPYSFTFGKFDVAAMLVFAATAMFMTGVVLALRRAREQAETELDRRRKAEARVVADFKAMERLQSVAAVFVRPGVTFGDCLREIMEAAVAIAGGSRGNLQILDRESGALKIAVQSGFERPFVDFFSGVQEPEDSVCGYAMHSIRRVIIEDVTASEIFAGKPSLAVLQAAGVRAVFSTPLISSAGNVIGMISVHFGKPHKPAERVLRMMDVLAGQAADFLERRQAEADLAVAHRKLGEYASQLEEKVNERSARLQEVVSELQHVSYAMVHDMRAPLRAMNAYAAAVLEEIDGRAEFSAESQNHCRRISKAALRLDKMIQGCLNYTKTVLAELPLEPVDLEELVADLIETYPNLSPDKADITIAQPLPVVLGNEGLLTECFANLLGNAVKFVADGVRAQICVRSENFDSCARIIVEDNGIGIPTQAQERLFNMFERLTARYEGTGVGLAIVRKVAERMGGRVGVESEPGEGSRFWVELRVAERAKAGG